MYKEYRKLQIVQRRSDLQFIYKYTALFRRVSFRSDLKWSGFNTSIYMFDIKMLKMILRDILIINLRMSIHKLQACLKLLILLIESTFKWINAFLRIFGNLYKKCF